MQVTAAVSSVANKPFEFRELNLDELRSNEVLVRLVATGVCHTDALLRDQVYPIALPAVLGHEGAGVVERIGSEVTAVAVGDHVVLSPNSCGVCAQCISGEPSYCEDSFGRNFGGTRPDGSTSLHDGDTPVSSMFFGQSSFSTFANVAERSVVKVDRDVDLSILGPLGCGIQTGAGAVLNELRPKPGSSFVVFGTGAVGSSAMMAAVVAGCTTIIAVDIVDNRLELALTLGATHVINSRTEDVSTRLQEITGNKGVNYALDTTGIPSVLKTAAENLAIRGTLALVGAAKPGTEVNFEIGLSLIKGWTFKTIIEGSSVPRTFIPALVRLWKQGRFPFDKLIEKYPFTEINRAFDDSEHGTTIKPVVIF